MWGPLTHDGTDDACKNRIEKLDILVSKIEKRRNDKDAVAYNCLVDYLNRHGGRLAREAFI